MAFTTGIPKRRLGEEHSPLHDRVVTELRQAILSGRLKPGERLIEGHLADELGVSRNPVREAIRALASEGLIEVTARRGAAVATMTEQEARETIEVRALLEGQNARLAARRQDGQIIKRIEAVLNRGTAAVAAKRFDQLFDLNQRFHSELAAAGQNTVLGDLLQRLRERTAAALAAEHVMRAGMDFLVGLNAGGDGPLLVLPEQHSAPDGAARKTSAKRQPSQQTESSVKGNPRSGDARRRRSHKSSRGTRPKPKATTS